nr:urokinase-type plasminogen activator-like [Lepeophtheirus salmonis]
MLRTNLATGLIFLLTAVILGECIISKKEIFDIIQHQCHCGIANEGSVKRKNKVPNYRIVHGYEPSNRPWMVRISIRTVGTHSSLSFCGGSLINRQWVLSAAHCFCIFNPCFSDLQGNTQLDYEASTHLEAIVGLSDMTLLPRHPQLLKKVLS